jgi:hypothetical protein
VLKRPIAVFLIITTVPQLSGCTVRTTQQVPPAELRPEELGGPGSPRLVGVTLVGGVRVTFDSLPAPSASGDMVYASVNGAPYLVERRKVLAMWVARPGQLPVEVRTSDIVQALTTYPGAHERIVGVTSVKGVAIEFDRGAPAYAARDTVFGTVHGAPYQIAVSDVQRIWVSRTDVALTTVASIGAVVGVVALVVGVVAVIALATKESCPFVYSWDGTRYVFDAEPYGGATTRGLERDDYAELHHLRPERGAYRLMVTNEVDETQYSNLLELLAVDHRPGVRVAADEHGSFYTLADERPPVAATDREGRDLLPWLRAADQVIWEPLPSDDTAGALRQEVTLTFPKPQGAAHAKLVANVATGLWGSEMIRQMLALWGGDVGAYYAALDGRASARDSLLTWNLREELYALKIYVQEPGGWRVGGVLSGGGPFIAAERVVPLDISRVVGDTLRIRLRPPVGFWALNSFAVDFTGDQAVRVDTLGLAEAWDSTGSVRDALAASDERYYVMPQAGDRAYLTFRAPPQRAGEERTVFLYARGYYRLHLPEAGAADTATLRRLRDEPGAVLNFAVERLARSRLARQNAP